MPDPFAKVNPGDPFEIPAVTWNAMLDVVRPNGKLGTSARSEGFTRPHTIIRVKNESGDDLPRCSVLGLDGPVFTPTDSLDAFLREPAFRGITPTTASHKRRYCVLLDPAKDGQFARAYFAGVCPVKIDLVDPTHRAGVIIDGDSAKLRSSRFGWSTILWTETDDGGYAYDTGVMWAIVEVGSLVSCEAVGQATTAITAADSYGNIGSGSVLIYHRSSGGTWESTGETITAYNASRDVGSYGGSISSGTRVAVAWDVDGTPWVAPLECG